MVDGRDFDSLMNQIIEYTSKYAKNLKSKNPDRMGVIVAGDSLTIITNDKGLKEMFI